MRESIRPALTCFFVSLLVGILPLALAAQTPASGAGSTEEAGAEGQIQPGDQVVLSIWREPDLSGTFTVDASGSITLPRLGAIAASDYTGSQLQALVRDEFGRYLRNPTIQVSVLRRVGVQGEVQRPGLYMIDLTKTLRDVISEAGGITETGNPNRIAIVREGQRIPLGSGETARYLAAELRSGDQVVVGRRSWFELNSLAIVSTAAVVVSVVVPLLRSAF